MNIPHPGIIPMRNKNFKQKIYPIMKKLYKFSAMALVGAAALGLYSCSNGNLSEITITPDIIDIPAGYDTPAPIRVNVEANHKWSVESACEWIVVSDINSTGFTVNITGGYVGYGPDVRSGTVKVSSQYGESPVTVSQDRVPYSTFEEWFGTYRVQYDQYTLLFDPSGKTYDFITTTEDLTGKPFVQGTILALDNMIPDEFEFDGTNVKLALEFLPDEYRMCVSLYYPDGCAMAPLTNGFHQVLLAPYVEMDPETKVLGLITEFDDISWGMARVKFPAPIFDGLYVYKNLVITHMGHEAPAAPAAR